MITNKTTAIVSLTTHGVRTKNILRTLYPIFQHDDVHVVLTIFSEDYKFLTNEIFSYIFNGKLEIFVSPIDLGPHLKYFFTMTRYRNLPIIVIDDDIIYPDDFIDELIELHSAWPTCILSRRPEKITFKDDKTLLHYHQWQRPYFADVPVFDSMPTGVGGILFPPSCFDLTHENIKELLARCKFDDDVYLKILSLRKKIPIKSVQSKTMYKKILDDEETQSIALYKTNWNRTISVLMSYIDEIQKIKDLSTLSI